MCQSWLIINCRLRATVGYSVLALALGLSLLWVLLRLLPAWIVKRVQINRTTQNKQHVQHKGMQLVGARQRASTLVYAKILISHFQVLLQFPLVMDIQFPETFREILNVFGVLKGDLLNLLKIQCVVECACACSMQS